MSMVRIPTDGLLYKGALFGTGLLGVILWRRDRLPKYMGIISIGAASVGLCSTLWHVLAGRFNIELHPPDTFYEEIASQVNEQLSQLSQQDISCGIRELRKHTVDENKEFDPIAYLQSGAKQTEVSDGTKTTDGGTKATDDGTKTTGDGTKTTDGGTKTTEKSILSQASSSKNSADVIKPELPAESETKFEEIASMDNSELSIEESDEEDSSSSELKLKEKRKFVLDINEMKLRLEKDLAPESEEQKSQKIRLLKEWETVYPAVEKEICGIKWSEKGLKVKEIFGINKLH